MKNLFFDVTIAIPAYSRLIEFECLLESIYNQKLMPRQILVCEDNSPDRCEIRALCDAWCSRFEEKGSVFSYQENEVNLGYDGNVRKLIANSVSKWVMLIGNDDLLLPECVQIVEQYLTNNPHTVCASRTFQRFQDGSTDIIGTSRLFEIDTLISPTTHPSRYIFRSCGFVGGLLFNREWANAKSTDRFDGTLYYQIYLACEAFCEHGIGYISMPTVAGRAGNAPLFGSAAAEKVVHVPGSYSPRGRARMWLSVINIFEEIGQKYSINLVDDIRKELSGRQAFHVFEMLAGAGRSINFEMKLELLKLDLFSGVVPNFLYGLNFIFGRYARIFYVLARRVVQ